MVKRWNSLSARMYDVTDVAIDEADYVLHSDYLKCKEALRLALHEWKGWQDENSGETDERIAALRKEFDL